MVNTKLSIDGMHCSSCAVVIQKELKKINGVDNASVNYANEKATITHDPELADTNALIAAVKKQVMRQTS